MPADLSGMTTRFGGFDLTKRRNPHPESKRGNVSPRYSSAPQRSTREWKAVEVNGFRYDLVLTARFELCVEKSKTRSSGSWYATPRRGTIKSPAGSLRLQQ